MSIDEMLVSMFMDGTYRRNVLSTPSETLGYVMALNASNSNFVHIWPGKNVSEASLSVIAGNASRRLVIARQIPDSSGNMVAGRLIDTEIESEAETIEFLTEDMISTMFFLLRETVTSQRALEVVSFYFINGCLPENSTWRMPRM